MLLVTLLPMSYISGIRPGPVTNITHTSREISSITAFFLPKNILSTDYIALTYPFWDLKDRQSNQIKYKICNADIYQHSDEQNYPVLLTTMCSIWHSLYYIPNVAQYYINQTWWHRLVTYTIKNKKGTPGIPQTPHACPTTLPGSCLFRKSTHSGWVVQQRAVSELTGPCTDWQSLHPSSGTPTLASRHAAGSEMCCII